MGPSAILRAIGIHTPIPGATMSAVNAVYHKICCAIAPCPANWPHSRISLCPGAGACIFFIIRDT